MKQCSVCKETLPLESFYYKQSQNWYYKMCKGCCANRYYSNYYTPKRRTKHNLSVKKYSKKKAQSARCRSCSAISSIALCQNCHILDFIRKKVHYVKRKYPTYLPMVQQRAAMLKQFLLPILRAPNGHKFPDYRLNHKVSLQRRPDLALLATNLEWKPVKKIVALLILLLCNIMLVLAYSSSPGLAYPAYCTSVVDGDTIDVSLGATPLSSYVITPGQTQRIRLAAIDCPEHNQPYGQEASDFMHACIYHQIVDIRPVTTDRYGRIVAWVFTGLYDGNIPVWQQWYAEHCLNTTLVRLGLAWHYVKYDKPGTEIFRVLYRLQATAAMNHAGLWQDTNPIPPWEWRHNR